jgi:hypothetical protein
MVPGLAVTAITIPSVDSNLIQVDNLGASASSFENRHWYSSDDRNLLDDGSGHWVRPVHSDSSDNWLLDVMDVVTVYHSLVDRLSDDLVAGHVHGLGSGSGVVPHRGYHCIEMHVSVWLSVELQINILSLHYRLDKGVVVDFPSRSGDGLVPRSFLQHRFPDYRRIGSVHRLGLNEVHSFAVVDHLFLVNRLGVNFFGRGSHNFVNDLFGVPSRPGLHGHVVDLGLPSIELQLHVLG